MPYAARRTVIALAASLSAGPVSAQVGRCPMPAETNGGVVNPHTMHVATRLLPAVIGPDTRASTLADRMRFFDVPGVSVAVIHRGHVAWARGWGVRDVASCRPVMPATAFQAASISKTVTAVVALRLAEQGQIGLDQDIDASLRSWRPSPNDARLRGGVTLRRLLSHTAGLGVHGFPGYLPGAPLPTATQVLDGLPPANTEAVRSVLPAGTEWRYSGGGYIAAQVALSDVSGLPFEALAVREVFRPLGMLRSAYAQPPSPTILADAALGHSDGKVIAGGYHVYPELAAAGLWTTAGDLAKLLVDIEAAAAGRKGGRLSPAMARTMLTPVKGGWGLGVQLFGTGAARRFGHDGVNEGFQATMLAYVGRGEGVVVLTNGARGRWLADEIIRAIASDYGWKELAAPATAEIELASKTRDRLVGSYEGGSLAVSIDARNGGLYVLTANPKPERLVPVGQRRFRTDASGILVEFARDYASFRILEGGPPVTFTRRAPVAASTATPIYLRGTMNGWSTATPLVREDAGWTVTTDLAPGDYKFKLGSDDWRAADYGTGTGESVTIGGPPTPLVPHGGNVRLAVTRKGSYRFLLKVDRDGRAQLAISDVVLP